MKYEVRYYPNWGMSRAYRIRCSDKYDMEFKFNNVELGGAGGVVRVSALIDGKEVMSKSIPEEE